MRIADGSDQSNIDIIPDDERIVYRHSADNGITPALNSVYEDAKGDLYCWANDDDLLLPGAFGLVIDEIDNCDWLYAMIRMKDQSGREVARMGHFVDLEEQMETNHIPQPTVFWTNKVKKSLGPFNEDPRIDLVSDYEYWTRMLAKFPNRKFVPGILVNYTVHPDSITSRITGKQLSQADVLRQMWKSGEIDLV